tara:strand:- start:976 stop:2166 length:1191 start_codon:yes stop_codon:yes gene_type:complete
MGPFATPADAAAEAHRRVKVVADVASTWRGKARNAAADWIDRHWPIIATANDAGAVNVAIFPEFVVSDRVRAVQQWTETALNALGPLRQGATPAEKVLHKGVAAFPSLRYIGPQMRKANIQNEGPAAPVLKEICRIHTLGLHKQSASLNLADRRRRWHTSHAAAVNALFMGARTAVLRTAIAHFIGVLCEDNMLLRHLWSRHRPEITSISLRGIFERVLRPKARTAKRKRLPAPGFGIELASPLPKCVCTRPKQPLPSAKRVRASLKPTPELIDAIARQRAPSTAIATLPRAQSGGETREFWVPHCAQCGWRKRPVGTSRKRTGFVIDVDTDLITCEDCNNPVQMFNVTHHQVSTQHGWARVCDECGAFTTQCRLKGIGAVCIKCYRKECRENSTL